MNKLTTWIIIAVAIIVAIPLIFNLVSDKEAVPKPTTPVPEVQVPAIVAAPVPEPAKTAQPKTYDINLTNSGFSPASLTIHTGDTIVWTNNDLTTHTVSSDIGKELNSGRFSTGVKYTHKFNTTGTYGYHCNIYPNLKGTIIVN